MMPPMNLSASSSATSRGGEFLGGGGGFNQGDWIVTTGAGDAGMSTKTMLIFAACGVGVLWLLNRQKKST